MYMEECWDMPRPGSETEMEHSGEMAKWTVDRRQWKKLGGEKVRQFNRSIMFT